MTNPLLSDWTGPFGLPPFDLIRDEDFAPALELALTAHRDEIAAITENPEPPTFAYTIESLEAAGKALDKVLSVFFTVAGADSNPAREALLDEALVTADEDALEQTLLELEASLVDAAVVLPLVEPAQLTISAPGVQGIAPRPGAASLTWNAWEWGVEQPAP